MIKKLLLIVTLSTSMAPIMAMEEAELRQRNRTALPNPENTNPDNQNVTQIDAQTKFSLLLRNLRRMLLRNFTNQIDI